MVVSRGPPQPRHHLGAPRGAGGALVSHRIGRAIADHEVSGAALGQGQPGSRGGRLRREGRDS